MENHSSNAYPYFGEELMMQQFSLLAESIQKALPPENEGQRAIAQQIANINNKQENGRKGSCKFIETAIYQSSRLRP
jgi:hypothetical protein